MDSLGKAIAARLLRMEIDAPDNLPRLAPSLYPSLASGGG